MIILHYLVRDLYLKSHLSFLHLKNIQQYFLLPSNCDSNLIPDHSKIITKSNLTQYSKQIINTINQLHPNAIIFSDYKLKELILTTLKKNNHKLFLFNHGVWCPGILNRRKTQHLTDPRLTLFDHLFFTKRELPFLLHCKVDPQQITTIHGFVGIDYLNITKPNHSTPNNILFIVNKAGFNYKQVYDLNQTVKEYQTILNILSKFAIHHDYQIYIKFKPTGQLEKKVRHNSLHKHKHIHTISSLDLIYPHLINSSIVIIQGYSTCYLESLYLDKPTILCQIPKTMDYLDIIKYKYLPQAYSTEQLMYLLNKFHHQNWKSDQLDQYHQQRNQYLDENLGLPIENVSQKIMNSISQHTTNEP